MNGHCLSSRKWWADTTRACSSLNGLKQVPSTGPSFRYRWCGSAGGLLMGAVTNLRPDLFGAVVSQVPFVDVLNTMSDASLPLTVGEYEEWGNPEVQEQFGWMREYDPYTNLRPAKYPTMLVRT